MPEPNKVDTKNVSPNGKPLQRVSYRTKNKEGKQWYKDTARWFLKNSSLYAETGMALSSVAENSPWRLKKLLYDVYNNKIPLSWFSHVTNPLGAKKPENKRYPAKIRPNNILRTNLDMLLSEWNRRPYPTYVQNLSPEAYSEYEEALNAAINESINSVFAKVLDAGGPENVPQEEFEVPQKVKQTFSSSYRDKQAIIAQRWLTKTLEVEGIKEKQHDMFKDWLIAGESFSLKGIYNKKLVYRRHSPLYIDYGRSPNLKYVEDAEYVVALHWMTASELTDFAFDQLTDKEWKKIEDLPNAFRDTQSFYSHLTSNTKNYKETKGLIPVFHICWQGRKKIRKVQVINQDTLQIEVVEVDEDYIVQESMGEVEIDSYWKSEPYEIWHCLDDIWFGAGPIYCSRGKMPYNGAVFSNTHSESISVEEIGIPYLIQYIIVSRSLEMTMARNKGKIILLDKQVIPREEGWDEEKFFYYSEANGWALINRNQAGVDKSMNQYTVLDMRLYDEIEYLIELQQHIKQEWDDILGITRQRKGASYATDTVGNNERSMFQSTVITDMIFLGFDRFVKRENQGLIELSQYLKTEPSKEMYNEDLVRDKVLEIVPEKYCLAKLGIMVTDAAEEKDVMELLKARSVEFLQNGMTATDFLKMVKTKNLAELEAKLTEMEAKKEQLEQGAAERETASQAALMDKQKEIAEFTEKLKRETMTREYELKRELLDYEEERRMSLETDEVISEEDMVIHKDNLKLAYDKLASEEKMKEKDIAQRREAAKLQAQAKRNSNSKTK